MIIVGFWYAANVSARRDAEIHLPVEVSSGDFTLHIDGRFYSTGNISDTKVSNRIGNIPRTLTMADGSVFETVDNQSMDQWLSACRYASSSGQWVHRLERSWSWAIASMLLVFMLGLFAYFRGLPVAAKRIAYALPVSAHESISSGAMATMDRVFFKPSAVDQQTQDELRSRFQALLAGVGDTEFTLRLHFRDMTIGGDQVPNALALPGGDIIVTDALLPLIEDPHELDSILLHEIGHVIERHGMQHVVQASAISVVATLAVGDLSGVGELAAGVPIFLMQSRYSRSSETDADTFAFEQMIKAGVDPAHFANAIKNITGESGDVDSPGYFSTHPGTAERMRRAIEYSNSRSNKQHNAGG